MLARFGGVVRGAGEYDGTQIAVGAFHGGNMLEATMRPVLLWFLGIPIPVIILLYVFHVL